LLGANTQENTIVNFSEHFEIVVRDLHKLFGLSKQPYAKIKLAALADRQCEINQIRR